MYLLNLAIVVVLLFFAVRKIVAGRIDRVLVVGTLIWAVAIFSGLFLSCFSLMGEAVYWFVVTVLVSICLCLFLQGRRSVTSPAEVDRKPEVNGLEPSWFQFALKLFALGTLGLVFLNTLVSVTHPPNNWDVNTYHLPRAFFYLGQGNLEHFETVNARQVYFGFNPTILFVWMLSFGLSEPLIKLINPACLMVCLVGVYRFAILCRASRESSLYVACLAVLAPQVFSQGAATTNDIELGALLICSAIFFLLYLRGLDGFWLLLSATAFGLSLGTKVTCLFFVAPIALAGLWAFFKAGSNRSFQFLQSNKGALVCAFLLVTLFSIPFVIYNYVSTGELMTARYDFLKNRPFSSLGMLQTAYTFTVQIFIFPLSYFFDPNWLDRVSSELFFPSWNREYAFNDLKVVLPELTENSVFFGVGPYLIVCAATSRMKSATVALGNRRGFAMSADSWFLVAALMWFLVYCAFGKWGMYTQRYFLPCFLLSMPFLGIFMDKMLFQRGGSRLVSFWRIMFMGAALLSIFMAVVLLWKSTYRSLPWTLRGIAPSVLNIIPPGLHDELREEKRINVIQYSGAHGDERQYPFLRVSPEAEFTPRQFSFDRLNGKEPSSLSGFNLISLWGGYEGVTFNKKNSNGWVLLRIDDKKTAGVKNLGTVGYWGTDHFKYFSYNPDAVATGQSNDHILVMATTDWGKRKWDTESAHEEKRSVRLVVVGLQREDGLVGRIYASFGDGSEKLLWKTSEEGFRYESLKAAYTRLTIEITDESGEIRNSSEIHAVDYSTVLQSANLSNFNPVHVLTPQNIVRIDGLAPPMGPYWPESLPRFCATTGREMSLSFENETSYEMESLSLNLTFMSMKTAGFSLSANRELIEQVGPMDPGSWRSRRFDVPLRKGENKLLFRFTSLEDASTDEGEPLFRFSEIQFRGVPLRRTHTMASEEKN